MVDDVAPIEFDPYSPEYYDDPYDLYRRMRDDAPVLHNTEIGFYALSRWDDVVVAERDWATYSSAYGIELDSLLSGTMHKFESLIMMDPPKHDRLRALVSRVFTPRAVGALEPMVRTVITDLLDGLDGRTEIDLLGEFAALFPVEIICRMLGVPAEGRQQVRLWLDDTLTREVGQTRGSAANLDAAVALGTYFYELAMEKRTNPGDDMMSRLTQVEVEEDDDGNLVGLDDVAIAGFGGLLGGAGAETVTKLVGNAIVLFERHADQWQMVRDDPSLIPAAFEEILRFLPPSQYQGRMTTRDVEIHSTVIPAMSPTLLVTGAATRDDRAFEDPDRFDITRPANLALGFGHGVHSCLGAALARMEGRIAIEELAKRYPSYEVVTEGLRRVQMTNVAGYSKVPIRLDSATARS